MNGIFLPWKYPFHRNRIYVELYLSLALIIFTPFSYIIGKMLYLVRANLLGLSLQVFIKMYFVFHLRVHVFYLFCHDSFCNGPVDQFIFFYILWGRRRRRLEISFFYSVRFNFFLYKIATLFKTFLSNTA